MTIQEKIAIVTGASSGIGKATAFALAKRGACITLAARNTSALEQVAQQIKDLGGEALVVTTDVTQQAQVNHMVQETLSRWGKVDILIANAGQYIRSPIAELTIPVLESAMAVNFFGGVYSVLAVLPYMLAQKSGHIVIVSTMDARKPLPPDAPYAAAKSALTGFGEVLRQELHGTGVFATIITPGRVDTPLIEDLKVPWISAKISAETVARAIVKGIERRQSEVILPFQAKPLYFLNAISPRLADWAVRFFNLQGWERWGGKPEKS